MKILITGGAGFIGSNFIRYFSKAHPDYTLINLDKLTYCGNLDNLKDMEQNPNYSFVKGDICDRELVMDLTKDCDAIIHFAAESHVDNSIKDPFVFINTNINGTLNLLEAARHNKIKKFLHISTDEVYGSINSGSFNEKSILSPNSPYSASKAAAEHLVRSYFITYSVPILITRSSNNFGPYQYPEKLIPLFITNLIENKKVPLYGDGLNVRDWLYVLDQCSALDFVFHNGKTGEVYNVAGGNEMGNIEITKKILSLLGKDESNIEYAQDRLGHDKRYSISGEKLSNLGWNPKFNFDEAILETVKWYTNNRTWWEKLKDKRSKIK